jgi:hypothetical protein
MRQMHRQTADPLNRVEAWFPLPGTPKLQPCTCKGWVIPNSLTAVASVCRICLRRHIVMAVLLIQIQFALVELECADTAGVDHFDPNAFGGIDDPGHIIVDRLLILFSRQHPQQKIVTAQHGIATLIQDRNVRPFPYAPDGH